MDRGHNPRRHRESGPGVRASTAGPLSTLLLVVVGSVPLQAQRLDTAACEAVRSAALCRAAAELAAVVTAHGPAIASGGNPVAGTASTLGKRMAGMPRVSVVIRRVSGSADLPDGAGAGGSTGATAWTGDVAVGVLDGLSPMTTVGGLFSLDLLGSVGVVQFPSADGFRSRTPVSWAAGARLGILRESFTMPGVSLSVMNRRTGRLTFGDAALETRDLHVRLDRVSTWSTRAVVGKRLGLFGFTGGFGWDRHSGRGIWRVRAADGTPTSFSFDSLHARRTLVFGGISWTTLVFNLSAEVGHQSGTAGATGAAANGGWFYGLAARLTF